MLYIKEISLMFRNSFQVAGAMILFLGEEVKENTLSGTLPERRLLYSKSH